MKRTREILTHRTHDGLIKQDVKKLIDIQRESYNNSIVINKAKELKGVSKIDTIKKCYDYVIATVPYKNDPPGIELITSPWLLITREVVGEDCESMVLLLASLLGLNGVKTRYVTIAHRTNNFTHVVLEAYNGERWIILDPTGNKRGYGQTIPEYRIKRKKNYGVNPMPKLVVETLSDPMGEQVQKRKCKRCGGHQRHANNKPQEYQPVININVNNDSDLSQKTSNSYRRGLAGGTSSNGTVKNETVNKTYIVKHVSEKAKTEAIKCHGNYAGTHSKKLAEETGKPNRVYQGGKTGNVYEYGADLV